MNLKVIKNNIYSYALYLESNTKIYYFQFLAVKGIDQFGISAGSNIHTFRSPEIFIDFYPNLIYMFHEKHLSSYFQHK